MRKLLLMAAIAALEMPLAPPGHAEDGAQPEDFYRYLSRVEVSVPNTPFIGTAADQPAFIGWTGGGPGVRLSGEESTSGSSLPARNSPSADKTLSLAALARAAVQSERAFHTAH